MAKSEKQKLKLLYIMQCLMEKTDEEHAVTTQDIIDYLALQGIAAERKSIYTDIDIANKSGEPVYVHCTAQNYENSPLCRLVFADVSKSREKNRRLNPNAMASSFENL